MVATLWQGIDQQERELHAVRPRSTRRPEGAERDAGRSERAAGSRRRAYSIGGRSLTRATEAWQERGLRDSYEALLKAM